MPSLLPSLPKLQYPENKPVGGRNCFKKGLRLGEMEMHINN